MIFIVQWSCAALEIKHLLPPFYWMIFPNKMIQHFHVKYLGNFFSFFLCKGVKISWLSCSGLMEFFKTESKPDRIRSTSISLAVLSISLEILSNTVALLLSKHDKEGRSSALVIFCQFKFEKSHNTALCILTSLCHSQQGLGGQVNFQSGTASPGGTQTTSHQIYFYQMNHILGILQC